MCRPTLLLCLQSDTFQKPSSAPHTPYIRMVCGPEQHVASSNKGQGVQAQLVREYQEVLRTPSCSYVQVSVAVQSIRMCRPRQLWTSWPSEPCNPHQAVPQVVPHPLLQGVIHHSQGHRASCLLLGLDSAQLLGLAPCAAPGNPPATTALHAPRICCVDLKLTWPGYGLCALQCYCPAPAALLLYQTCSC
jgi:hypothetical protein